MRRKLVAGNWKMNGSLSANGGLLADILAGLGDVPCEVMVCPPFPYLAQAQAVLSASPVGLGAHTLSEYPAGAFTGEVGAEMLREFGCRYVLVGHSERRSLFGESDAVVAAKLAAALAAGLVPVLCLGETLAEREAGQTEAVVSRQLQAVLDRVGVAALSGVVLAYEPVWAIGTGLTATPAQAQAVHAHIRACLAARDAAVAAEVRILYGGSVKPQNAQELFGQQDIDGGLIGGASLVAEDFLAICRAAN
jgi:triosephosphate isomerase